MAAMTELAGRVALVTGGASGIGLGAAQALASRGVRIVLADIDARQLALAQPTVAAESLAVQLDVSDRSAWARARAEAEARFGQVDILVQSAGIGPDGRSLAAMQPESFDRLIRINLTGVYNGVSAFAPGMAERGLGHIVNIASVAGLMPIPTIGAYVAAKFGVVGLSETLRIELGPSGVGVSVVCPGGVRTRLAETTRAAGSDRSEDLPGGSAARPTGRILEPIEVGAMIVRAIEENIGLVITHPESDAGVRQHAAAIEAAYDWARTNFPPP
ncbi:MAG: SDR family oxidoreductase [Caulobacteraceae bacterium]|nr:SDR family oxidoreductase [Caulobacteraceae bacterium]